MNVMSTTSLLLAIPPPSQCSIEAETSRAHIYILGKLFSLTLNPRVAPGGRATMGSCPGEYAAPTTTSTLYSGDRRLKWSRSYEFGTSWPEKVRITLFVLTIVLLTACVALVRSTI